MVRHERWQQCGVSAWSLGAGSAAEVRALLQLGGQPGAPASLWQAPGASALL